MRAQNRFLKHCQFEGANYFRTFVRDKRGGPFNVRTSSREIIGSLFYIYIFLCVFFNLLQYIRDEREQDYFFKEYIVHKRYTVDEKDIRVPPRFAILDSSLSC